MSNKYAGYCADCKASCGPNHGELVKVDGKWQVRCGKKSGHKAAAPEKRQTSRKPNHRDGETITADEMMARVAGLAEKASVTVTGTSATSYTAQDVVVVGATRKTKKDGWVLVVALGAYDRYYHSESDCEDMDCFCGDYGWHEDQQYYGVQCSEPGNVKADREQREAKMAAEKAAAANTAAEWARRLAAIPPEYKQRHGALYGGMVTLAGPAGGWSDEIAKTGATLAGLAWTETARYAEPYQRDANKTKTTHVLRSATLADGRTVYEHQTYDYDDYRTTFHLPAELYGQVLALEVARRGITSKQAAEWLAKFRGCVDTDIYEFAAKAAENSAAPITID